MKDQEVNNSTSYARSLVIGTLLGDASLRLRKSSSSTTAQLIVAHSLQQADLVEWKAAELSRLYGRQVSVSYNFNCNRASCHLTQSSRLRVIHRWFHRNSRKVVTAKIRFMSHPIGLAMLLCDDGSILKRKKRHKDGTFYYLSPCITVATHGFDNESVHILLDWVESLCGARGYINPERRLRSGRVKEYNRIRYDAAYSKLLWDYVKPWIPAVPSMLDKFSFAIERYGVN